MARSWRHAKLSLASAPLTLTLTLNPCVARVSPLKSVYAMHPFPLWFPCVSLRPTYPCWCLPFFLFFWSFFFFFAFMLSLELCRCSFDLFVFSRRHIVSGGQPRILLGMVEARSVSGKNTDTHFFASVRGFRNSIIDSLLG